MTATNAKRKRRWWVWLIPLGAIPLLVILFVAIALKPYRIPSEAMAPTLEPKDRIVVRRGAGGAKVGDIVVVRAPTGATGESGGPQCGQPVKEDELCAESTGKRSDLSFVKRVVGRGGDRIAMRKGRVIRNGEPVEEPYVRACSAGAACDFPKEITVPRGQIYLLGDNRGESDDSRFWGAVPEEWVVGPVFARYWPPSRWGAPD
jgi:signal peptidase I